MSLWKRLLFPPKCVGCGELLPFGGWSGEQKIPLCEKCLSKWEEEKREPCEHCMQEIQSCNCMTKMQEKAGCASYWKLAFYRHGVRNPVQNRMIYRLKDAKDDTLSAFLIKSFAERLRAECRAGKMKEETLLITFVPRSRKTVLKSGSDQAKQLAKALSEEIGVAWETLIVRKRFAGKEQKKLSPSARSKNAKKQFFLFPGVNVSGKTILLLDDVVTTGATMAVCAKLLLHAGAEKVLCLSVATDDANRSPAVRQPDFTVG